MLGLLCTTPETGSNRDPVVACRLDRLVLAGAFRLLFELLSGGSVCG